MDIKVSVNIIEGGHIERIHYTVKSERFDKKKGLKVKSNFDIDFSMNPTPKRIRVINLTPDAYDAMISDVPTGVKKGDWNRLSKVKKLEYNLKLLAENFNGVLDNYEVFED